MRVKSTPLTCVNTHRVDTPANLEVESRQERGSIWIVRIIFWFFGFSCTREMRQSQRRDRNWMTKWSNPCQTRSALKCTSSKNWLTVNFQWIQDRKSVQLLAPHYCSVGRFGFLCPASQRKRRIRSAHLRYCGIRFTTNHFGGEPILERALHLSAI